MPTQPNPYRHGLDPTAANHVALTPVSFLDWAADVYPERCAVIHGPLRRTWRGLRERARRLASSLSAQSIGEGDTVAVMLPNTPPMIEAHFGVPMSGAVLHCINTRLDAATVAFVLEHSDSRVLIVDREFAGTAAAAVERLRAQGRAAPFVIDVDDPEYVGPGQAFGEVHGTVPPAAAAEGDGDVAAGFRAQLGQPGVEEAFDLRYVVGDFRLRLQVAAHVGVAAGQRAQARVPVRIGQHPRIEHEIGLRRQAAAVGE